jgi:hypothetical protein
MLRHKLWHHLWYRRWYYRIFTPTWFRVYVLRRGLEPKPEDFPFGVSDFGRATDTANGPDYRYQHGKRARLMERAP